MIHSTVHSLRSVGHRVRVSHLRYANISGWSSLPIPHHFSEDGVGRTDFIRDLDGTFDPKGGMTVVDITLTDGRTARGRALFARDENYNRKEGLACALDDALAKLDYVQPVYVRTTISTSVVVVTERSFWQGRLTTAPSMESTEKGVLVVLRRQKERPNAKRVVIATNLRDSMREVTLRWLRENGFPPDSKVSDFPFL